MSRGLGHLQREIMATLAARSGGDELEDYRGYRAWIADGAHDLRAVTREMARRMGGSNRHGFINIAWQASFSRAVAGLVSRELIEILWLVPLRGFDDDFPMRREHLADGHYIVWGSRQRRFVRVPDVSVMTTVITLNETASRPATA